MILSCWPEANQTDPLAMFVPVTNDGPTPIAAGTEVSWPQDRIEVADDSARYFHSFVAAVVETIQPHQIGLVRLRSAEFRR